MQATTKKFKPQFTLEQITIAIIILAGAILRIRQYLIGRSLWVDEAMLALNIVNRNFLDLLKPLDYDQGAPIGFLLIEKIFNTLLGRNEYALRLFPLMLGILSLWLFYLLLKRLSYGVSTHIALALFAFNPVLIYYSSEVKQYIGDILITISLYLLVTHFFEAPSRKRLGIIVLAGFIALWFSHPTLFILAGIGIVIFFSYFQKRDYASMGLVAGMGVFWLVNVGILYTFTLGNLQHNSYMRNYWQKAFAPMPPWSNLKWYWEIFQGNANSHFAITFAPWILLLLMLMGWIVLFKQDRRFASTIVWTIFFTLLASSLSLYPSAERMALFLVPIGVLLIGASLTFINQKLRDRKSLSMLILAGVSVYLFYGALPRTIEQFISPKFFEHIRPTMDYLQSAWEDGDAMYISNGGIPAFEYYAPMYGLEEVPYIAGSRDDYQNKDEMIRKLGPLKGNQRVWVLFSHVYEREDFNEKDFILAYLKKNGNKTREFRETGTSVFLYLFDLSR